MTRIAVTGRPGCGKTTLCRRIAEGYGGSVGGLLTEEIREEGGRKGFKLEDLATGETALLSHVRECSGPKVGKYSVCLDQLNSLAPQAIKRGREKCELLIIDEIGPMELKSQTFVSSVNSACEVDVNCLFTIHRSSEHPLLKEIRDSFELRELTAENRDRVFRELLSLYKRSG